VSHESCPHCQASPYAGLSYEDELEAKLGMLRESLVSEPGLPELLPAGLLEGLELHAAPRREGYRNTVKLVFGWERVARRALLGIYAPGSHRLLDLAACRDHHPAMAPILAFVSEGVARHGLPVYHEERAKGFLRYFLLRVLPDGRALCCFVTPHAEGAWQEKVEALAHELRGAFPELRSIAQNLNPTRGNAVLGAVTQTLAGQFSVPCRFLETSVPVTATCFLQANLEQFRAILARLDAFRAEREAAQAGRPLRVADLYCGCGAIGRSITRSQPLFLLEGEHASQVPLVEGAREDGREEIEVVRGRVEDCLTSLELFEPDLAVADPPRKGLDPALLDWLASQRPAALALLSCNPATLARDLRRLLAAGYRLRGLAGYDMMPGVAHVEALALLDRTRRDSTSIRKT
jgi:23S rRNA (uracil1939-C5)-methyltransferase